MFQKASFCPLLMLHIGSASLLL